MGPYWGFCLDLSFGWFSFFCFFVCLYHRELKVEGEKSKTASMGIFSLLEKALQCKRESANLHCGKRIKRQKREIILFHTF